MIRNFIGTQSGKKVQIIKLTIMYVICRSYFICEHIVMIQYQTYCLFLAITQMIAFIEKTREGPPLRVFKHSIYYNVINLFKFIKKQNSKLKHALTHKIPV